MFKEIMAWIGQKELTHWFYMFKEIVTLDILRAFDIKMSRVASRIYALLSVIRQQMSPFGPFRGGGMPKGDNVPFFYRFFYLRASLMYHFYLFKDLFFVCLCGGFILDFIKTASYIYWSADLVLVL